MNHETVKTTQHAFSWLSTRKVCQRWSPFYAVLSGPLGANAT